MKNTWKQMPDAATDEWDWVISGDSRCHATQYAGTENYCWQGVRGDFRLSGIVVGREAAMERAEEIIALPIEEFNRRVVVELMAKLHEIERDITRLSPSTDILPGYAAGYEAGISAIKCRISAAMNEGV